MAVYTGELVDTADVPVAEPEKTATKAKAKFTTSAAAPIAAAVPVPAVVAAPLTGNAVERVAQNIGQAGTIATNAADNAVQSGDDFLMRHPELYAIPAAYAAHKIAKETGLYSTLGEKIKEKLTSTPAQPQPFVGGAGPRVTPPVTTPTPQPQAWDIHNDPSFGGFFGDVTAPAATPIAASAAAPVNTKLEELKARAAAGASTAASATPEVASAKTPWAPPTAEVINKPSMFPSGSTIGTTPIRPVTPTPPAALAATTAPVTPAPVPPTGYNKRVTEAIAGVPQSVQDQLAKEGKVALRGYGAGDINVTNTYGPPAYQKLVEYFNEGKPIGSYENYLEVNKKIQKGVPASLASEFASTLPASEQEAGNFGKAFGEVAAYTKDGKIVKSPSAIKNAVAGGGAVVLLTSIPNLANAATSTAQGKYAQAGGQAAEVGMNFMPPALQALTYAKGAGEGEDTEMARQRRMAEYVQRAGRGVAQGYDPRRLIGVAPPAR